jgi:hypothetical protein
VGPRTGIKRLAAAGAAAVIGVASTIVLIQGSATASSSFGYSGFAHGTYVFSGLVDHGPQASSVLACTRRVGLHADNDLSAATVNRQALARTVRTDVDTHNDRRGDGTSSKATAVEIKIGSLLHLTGVTTRASAVYKNGSFQTDAGTTFLGGRIGGVRVPMAGRPSPNTKLPIPGLGFAVLNWVSTQKTSHSASTAAAAVLIHSTVRNSYLPKGVTVAVLLTKAEVGGPSSSILRGKAYTTQVRVGDLVKSSPTSLQTTCLGTNGKKQVVGVAVVTVPGIGQVRGMATTKYGRLSPTPAVAFTSEIAGAEIGTGSARIVVGAIKTRAAATKDSAGRVVVSYHSQVTSLTAGGKTIDIPTKNNQTLSLPGIGLLTFNKVVRKGNHVAVTGLEIKLNAMNSALQLAQSEAGIVG